MTGYALCFFRKGAFKNICIQYQQKVWNRYYEERIQGQRLYEITVQNSIQCPLRAARWASISRQQLEWTFGHCYRCFGVDIIVQNYCRHNQQAYKNVYYDFLCQNRSSNNQKTQFAYVTTPNRRRNR